MTNPDPKPGQVLLTVWVDPPPEGMEWKVSEFIPQREYYAGKMVTLEAVLRPIVPATVMVEMTREDAKDHAKRCDRHGADLRECNLLFKECRLAAAARAALARKPCSVMVCRTSGDFAECGWASIARGGDVGNHTDRRPCKLAEGHGGGYE